jgi:hypothetical protein
MLNTIAPFFIVDDLATTLAFYQSKLGFEVRYKGGGDGTGDDFFAIVGRDRGHADAQGHHARGPSPAEPFASRMGPPGTPTSTRKIPTHCTQSSPAGRFPCIGSWPILTMDSGPSRSSITTDMCCALGDRWRSSCGAGVAGASIVFCKKIPSLLSWALRLQRNPDVVRSTVWNRTLKQERRRTNFSK